MKSHIAGPILNFLTGGLIYWIFLPMMFLLVSSCSEHTEEYGQLSDEEKRSAENALAGIDVRKGLEATLFASEDLLVNPTNMDIDAEGRVWVTEGYNYRSPLNPDNPTRPEGDRIVILQDTDADGRADTSKVFYQGNDINAALGILVLDHRVIVSRSPHVFVFYDTDGDDKADRKEVMFSGIGGEHHDHGMHAFVFGPDGKLYFNMGNKAEVIKDAEGNIIEDTFGNKIQIGGDPYRQGMVFRSNLDGSDIEVLGHNFRNNYEVAIDSYGTLWQSDNDDDGNEGTRINYVMEYGNYGYSDELTGAGWKTRRTGMAADIPTRHWHQNDPGSIPNLLQTGAGSPTGILFYEGDLLPEVFHNTIIHADAGPNGIRSYPIEKDGAGYSADIEHILKGDEDQWFRPSDVTVAPDGSIFVADWYDPGVGGHQMGDQQRGRIFRVAPEGSDYRVPEFDLSTPAGAIEMLKSPNLHSRAQAWLRLHDWGAEAEQTLVTLWESGNERFRARALWLLSKLEDKGTDYIEQALADNNPDIRITGLRAARQLKVEIIPYIRKLVQDPAPEVRRETAIALHHTNADGAADLWTQLALQHNGHDRWYLEALGIGAAGQWDRFFGKWLEEVGSEWNTPAGRDIIWRSRADAAVPLLAQIIKDPSIGAEEKPRYFRAFHFHPSSEKEDELIGILQETLPDQQRLNTMALKELDPSVLQRSTVVQKALEEALASAKGTQEYLDLVEHYELENRNEELLALMRSYHDSSLGIRASQLYAAAAETLSDSRRGDVRQLVSDLTGERQRPQVDLPPIPELANREGSPEKGREIFEQSCQICHRVNGQGIEFGPALNGIGEKLPRESLYDAILNPSSGISFGYEGYILTLKDSTVIAGIIQSETQSELILLSPGGYPATYPKSRIGSREQMKRSLMPENLHAVMSQQELVDLVEYLASLK